MSNTSTATLFIEDWYSRCGRCGGNASPYDKRHVKGGQGRGDQTPLDYNEGCGAPFIDKDGEGAHVMRMDLPYSPERIERNLKAMERASSPILTGLTVHRTDGRVEHDWDLDRLMRHDGKATHAVVRKPTDDGVFMFKTIPHEMLREWNPARRELANMCHVPPHMIDKWSKEEEA